MKDIITKFENTSSEQIARSYVGHLDMLGRSENSDGTPHAYHRENAKEIALENLIKKRDKAISFKKLKDAEAYDQVINHIGG